MIACGRRDYGKYPNPLRFTISNPLNHKADSGSANQPILAALIRPAAISGAGEGIAFCFITTCSVPPHPAGWTHGHTMYHIDQPTIRTPKVAIL